MISKYHQTPYLNRAPWINHSLKTPVQVIRQQNHRLFKLVQSCYPQTEYPRTSFSKTNVSYRCYHPTGWKALKIAQSVGFGHPWSSKWAMTMMKPWGWLVVGGWVPSAVESQWNPSSSRVSCSPTTWLPRDRARNIFGGARRAPVAITNWLLSVWHTHTYTHKHDTMIHIPW